MANLARKKILIVDDEEDARKNLRSVLRDFEDQIRIIGEAENAAMARIIIEKEEVDLMFLDIAMPRESGFDLLKSLPDYQGEVIFITSYNHFAERAFKYFALGYITKPIDRSEFREVLSRTLEILSLKNERSSYKQILDYLDPNHAQSSNLIVPTSEGYEILKKDRILYLEGQRNYTKIVSDDGELLVSRNLATIGPMLGSDSFMRVHRSFLVNVTRVRKITFDGELILQDGSCVKIAKQHRDEIIRKLNEN